MKIFWDEMGQAGGKGGKNGAGPEDVKLWKAYTRDIEPLGKTLEAEAQEEEKPKQAPPPKSSKPKKTEAKAVPFKAPNLPVTVKDVQIPQLDGRTEGRLKRGKLEIEGRLDLHGDSQAEAQDRLEAFIIRAHKSGKRCVLVITGKGGRGLTDGRTSGILRTRLPQWLEAAPLKGLVLKYYPAAVKDGGSGAWYVYLKRTRKDG